MASLTRLKSIWRYWRLWPPPWCRRVMRPFTFRPPLFFSGSVRLFSGSVFVISSNDETDMKRRPGEVGLYLRMAKLRHPPVHPSEAIGQTSQPENVQHFSAQACAPSKISIDSPALIW